MYFILFVFNHTIYSKYNIFYLWLTVNQSDTSTQNSKIREALLNLESQLFNHSLSAEEYFILVVSECEDDLKQAKHAIENVLRKLEKNYSKDQEEKYSLLQWKYNTHQGHYTC